jgi:hypothetical protein
LRALGFLDWEYPTALITEIDTTAGSTASLDLKGVRVQGFGTPDLDFPSFQLLLAKTVEAVLNNLRNYITSQPSSPPLKVMKWGATIFEKPTFDDLINWQAIQLWNPYGDTWDPPGPWWIRLVLGTTLWPFGGNPTEARVLEILAKCPGGIYWKEQDKLFCEFEGLVDPHSTIPVGAGFQPPADFDAPGLNVIFVPINEPEGGWISYLTDKAANPNAKYGSRLNPVHSDRRWVPGLAKTLEKTRVIRPVLQFSSSPQP